MPPNTSNPQSPPSVTAIGIDIIYRLMEIFKANDWNMHDEFDYGEGDDQDNAKENLFGRFCQLLASMDSEEQELIFKLTKNYKNYGMSNYSKLLDDTLHGIDVNSVKRCEQIYLLPLIAPSDRSRHETKSGHSLLYFAKNQISKINSFKGKKVFSLDNIDALNSAPHLRRSRSMIIFFDDFVGTGETAVEALDEYDMRYANLKDIPWIACLVAQERGFEKVREFGVAISAAQIRKRGISDCREFESDPDIALKIMERIERRINVSDRFRFGYGRSEALVTMARTPNNTFPIFWFAKGKTALKAVPFPRSLTR